MYFAAVAAKCCFIRCTRNRRLLAASCLVARQIFSLDWSHKSETTFVCPQILKCIIVKLWLLGKRVLAAINPEFNPVTTSWLEHTVKSLPPWFVSQIIRYPESHSLHHQVRPRAHCNIPIVSVSSIHYIPSNMHWWIFIKICLFNLNCCMRRTVSVNSVEVFGACIHRQSASWNVFWFKLQNSPVC